MATRIVLNFPRHEVLTKDVFLLLKFTFLDSYTQITHIILLKRLSLSLSLSLQPSADHGLLVHDVS
jgi:hypothetical protein